MVSIILPTYNEAANIRRVVRRIKKHVKHAEIIVVDDNSPDKTWKKARKTGVKVVRRLNDRGLAKSVVEGIKHATHDKIIVMDADSQHPAKTLPLIIEKLERNEFVVASRRLPTKSLNKQRILLSQALNYFIRKLLGVKVFDPLTGYFGFHKVVYERAKPRLKPRGYKIMLELLVKSGAEPAEIFFEFQPRTAGKSKTSVKVGIELLVQLVENFFARKH